VLAFLLRKGSIQSQSFLVIAKVLFVGKMLQDEFGGRYQSNRLAFRAPNKACSRLGVRAALF
jgi:hypothetical protein